MAYDGAVYAALLKEGAQRLRRERGRINAINTFPVPDQDSGTNMFYTMQAAAEAAPSDEPRVGAVARKATRAALLSARGNSGIILSQILSGISKPVRDKETFTARDLSEGFDVARALAYRSVTEPVEGTILTVIRRVAELAGDLAGQAEDLYSFLDKLARAARKALTETRNPQDTLRKGDGLDAGGLGLCVILEGMRDALRSPASLVAGDESQGERGMHASRGAHIEAPRVAPDARYGWEVQYIVIGSALDSEAIRASLSPLGDSLLVVGDEETLKVHIHTLRPQEVIDYSVELGDLTQLTFVNMDEQVAELKGDA